MTNICKSFLIILSAFYGGALSFNAMAEQAPNPRAASNPVINVSTARSAGNEVQRGSFVDSEVESEIVSRTATNRPSSVVSRAGTLPVITSNTASARGAGTVSRSAVSSGTGGRINTTAARSAAVTAPSVARSAGTVVRTAATGSSNVIKASRAATSRATAIFTDTSKIGGGYSACREAYATCMDQFCANANDTYRRCFCSDRFIEFRDMESAFDEAKTLLAKFQDNNLNAVGMSAAEVNAMYTASEGEQAIKNDTSAAASMLTEIGDLLSGKKKTTSNTVSLEEMMNNLNFDFTVDIDDIWGGGNGGLFGENNDVNLADLEGNSLFTEADKQCLQLIADSCESDAVLTMAKSAYNILITQDCNTYEKSINAQKEAIEQTVRTAEKYLREARLEEYRSHNSDDVNTCIANVRTALTADVACGANYTRCLDYSGAYININTGEPIYSPRLFQLSDMIILNGDADVLAQNSEFNSFLDSKRIFAESALDTCRDISDIVWEEFKRTALIEIAQAQDAKIEEIKSSCVSTMAECYDTQSNALKSFDNTTAQAVGALSALAARDMCAEKVSACAALYGNGSDCKFDNDGKLEDESRYCGLGSLLNYVNSVDTIKVAEGCETGISNFLTQLCTPSSVEGGEYPWGCRTMAVGTEQDGVGEDKTTNTIWAQVNARKTIYCGDSNGGLTKLDPMIESSISRLVESIRTDLSIMFDEKCEENEGIWYSAQDGQLEASIMNATREESFYQNVFAGSSGSTYSKNSENYGICVQNSVKHNCDLWNEAMGSTDYTTFDAVNNTCVFSDAWYEQHCEYIDGIWIDGKCYR